jgi:hypothetical protein
MMVPTPRNEFHEQGPKSEFDRALETAQGRLFEAVWLQDGGDYKHFEIGISEETGATIATFVLTQSHRQMVQGGAELIALSVPISPEDTENPLPSEFADYFLVGKPYDYAGRIPVTAENYDRLFVTAPRPLVHGFLEKIRDYPLVPLVRSSLAI